MVTTPVGWRAVPPPAPEDQPAAISRRTLLLGAGFGVANLALVGLLLNNDDTSSSTAPTRSRVVVRGDREHPGPPSLEGAAPPPPAGHVFDRVITGGRVIDPETGYDQVADVGIDGTQITSISTKPLQGKVTTDATNLVVAPGFIDLLSYEPNDYGTWFKIGDGVTTNLGMHGLNSLPEPFFNLYASDGNRPPVHYGGAFDDPWMRTHDGCRPGPRSRSQVSELSPQVESGFASGWLGVDFEPEYTPWVTDTEITALATVAAKHQMPVFFHARYSSPTDPGKNNAAAIAEVLQIAAGDGRIGARRPHHQHRRHPHDGAEHRDPRAGPRQWSRRHRLHVPVQLLGHVPGVDPLRAGLAAALRDHLQRPAGSGHRPAAHRVELPALPARRTSWSPPTPSPRPTSSPGCRRPGS